MPRMSIEQAAYLAGAIDGEGHISLVPGGRFREGRKTPSFHFRLQVTNTNRAWLEELQRWVGGRIDLSRSRGNKRPCYVLRFGGMEAAEVIGQCQPYLLLKKPHAQLMLRYFELAAQRRSSNPPGRSSDPQVVAQIQAIYEELRSRNLRGLRPVVNPGPPVTDRTCSLEGCGRKHYSNGYCKTHYKKYVERGGPTSYEKNCARCKTLFLSKRSDARFCSKHCADLSYYERTKVST